MVTRLAHGPLVLASSKQAEMAVAAASRRLPNHLETRAYAVVAAKQAIMKPVSAALGVGSDDIHVAARLARAPTAAAGCRVLC